VLLNLVAVSVLEKNTVVPQSWELASQRATRSCRLETLREQFKKRGCLPAEKSAASIEFRMIKQRGGEGGRPELEKRKTVKERSEIMGVSDLPCDRQECEGEGDRYSGRKSYRSRRIQSSTRKLQTPKKGVQILRLSRRRTREVVGVRSLRNGILENTSPGTLPGSIL